MTGKGTYIVTQVGFPIHARHFGTPSVPQNCPGAQILALAGPSEQEKSEVEAKEQEQEEREEEGLRVLAPIRAQIGARGASET